MSNPAARGNPTTHNPFRSTTVHKLTLLLSLGATLALACSDKSDDTGATGDGGATDGGATDGGAGDGGAGDGGADGGAGDGGSDTEWADMTFDERKAYMQGTVEPTMRAIFQAYDADRFADFGCATCHGSGYTDETFSMPNDGPPELDYADWPDVTTGTAKFMADEVAPTIIDLLDAVPYNPGTGEGIGCLSCHSLVK